MSYGQSKTCNCLFSLGLTNRYENEGIVSNAVMPGAIMTNLQRHMSKETWISKGWMDADGKMSFPFKSVEAGAATSVWAAISTELEGKGGLYLENCGIGIEGENVKEIFGKFSGYMPYIMDENNANKLWAISEQYVKNKSS